MTDPRITAMTEALRRHRERFLADPESFDTDERVAASIVELLPPNWCGHSAERLIDSHATGGLVSPDWNADGRAIVGESGAEQRIAVAHLRKIEEAAREIFSDRDDNYCFSCHDTLPCAHDALRAALEAE